MILLERTNSGFTVRVHWDKDSGAVSLLGATELHTEGVEIPPAEVMEAFLHPCLYFTSPNSFFKAPPEGAFDLDTLAPDESELIPF